MRPRGASALSLRAAGRNDHKQGLWRDGPSVLTSQVSPLDRRHLSETPPPTLILWNSSEQGAEKSQWPSRHYPQALAPCGFPCQLNRMAGHSQDKADLRRVTKQMPFSTRRSCELRFVPPPHTHTPLYVRDPARIPNLSQDQSSSPRPLLQPLLTGQSHRGLFCLPLKLQARINHSTESSREFLLPA